MVKVLENLVFIKQIFANVTETMTIFSCCLGALSINVNTAWCWNISKSPAHSIIWILRCANDPRMCFPMQVPSLSLWSACQLEPSKSGNPKTSDNGVLRLTQEDKQIKKCLSK